MGSYDYVHTGRHCGQVKCWGKGFNEYAPGSKVVLHRQVSQGEFAALMGGSTLSEMEIGMAGVPDEHIGDYQVLCSNDFMLTVRNGIFTEVTRIRDTSIPLMGNNGRPFDTDLPRSGYLSRSDDCEVCASLREEQRKGG